MDDAVAENTQRQAAWLETTFLAGFIVTVLLLPFVIWTSVRDTNMQLMELNAAEISDAVTGVRTYYAQNVVNRVLASNGTVTLTDQYQEVHGGIPIPATFSIEIGQVFDQSHDDVAFEYAFTSDAPFARRVRDPMTNFQAEALEAFRSDASLEVFSASQGTWFGTQSYEYATPVVMGEGCVSCHNSHPDSPRRDWTVGDVRGVQTVRIENLDTGGFGNRFLYGYLATFAFFGAGAVGIFTRTAGRLERSNGSLRDAQRRVTEFADELKEKVDELELLGAVADRSTFGITIADARDPEFPLIYANAAFYELTGFGEAEVVGRNCRFLRGPDTSTEATQGIRTALREGRSHTVELVNYRKSGEPFWNRLTLFPVGGQSGRPAYYVGYQVDVTDVYDNAAEREAMLTEIQEAQKSESLGVLVAGVAHEINTPLGVALTAATYARDAIGEIEELVSSNPDMADRVRDALEDERSAFDLIVTNLERSANLVRDFKNVAADRSQKLRRRVDVTEYARSVVATLHPLLRRTGCTASVEAAGPVEAIIDTGSFGQVLNNLIVNSTVHAFDGIDDGAISIRVSLEGDRVLVDVADNGRGIPPEARPRLFTPFFTTRRSAGGTGLGLYLAQRLVREELGGDITLQPSTQGARFSVSFPARPSDAALSNDDDAEEAG